MSTKKRKSGSADVASLVKELKDSIPLAKAQLQSQSQIEKDDATKALWRMGTVAEQIAAAGAGLKEDTRDWLDQEGVNLWNLSSLPSLAASKDGEKGKSKQSSTELEVVAALRHAAFRLIEAGLEPKPGVDSLIHVLTLASKTGATLAEASRNDKAGVVLSSAARWEDILRTIKEKGGPESKAIEGRKAQALVVYLSCRMEAAAKEGNLTVAEFMAQKITGDEARLKLLPRHDRTILAAKLHDIGRMVLKESASTPSNSTSTIHGRTPQEAVNWTQKAYAVAEGCHDANQSNVEGIEPKLHARNEALRLCILRTLARAYFLAASYDRAEATLDEILGANVSVDAFDREQEQELRWLRLAILRRRDAGESQMLDAFKDIVDHMELSETRLTDVLQELRTMSHQQVLVSTVHLHCLKRALAAEARGSNGGDGFTDRLLLSLIVHSSKDEDHTRAIGVLDEAFTCVREANYLLQTIPATACLTLMWQYGDRHYQAKRFGASADWFLAGSHALFPTPGTSKCFRKAALCYIENREYAKACAVLRKCDPREAKTQYVRFLVAVGQGIDDEAIKAVQEMSACPDFDRKMLLLATQVSHASENKGILLAALKALLQSLKLEGEAGQGGGHGVVEAMTLIRCIVKLVLKLLTEPAANRPILIDTIVEHLRAAVALVETAQTQKTIHLISKDISWLWRTAYNCAVQGCSEWEACEERISDLFDISRDLLDTSCETSPVDVDADVYMHLIIASFSGVAGRVFAFRQVQEENPSAQETDKIRKIAVQLERCRKKINQISGRGVIVDEGDVTRIEYFVHTLRVFEVEMLARLKDWDGVIRIVNDAVSAGPLATSTYEAIADVLWVEKDCPINVLYGGLEAILRASLDHNALSIEKFSRWLRAICTIILARNSAEDRVKAIGYVEQAIDVMEQSVRDDDQAYPTDERFWLLSTSYNTGFECLEASALDEAKRWFEAATVICRFVPGGEARAEKISETYTQLLERYAPG